LREVRITNLSVGNASVDLLLLRHEEEVGVNVLGRQGEIGVTVAH
jgi:hypothetical protein